MKSKSLWLVLTSLLLSAVSSLSLAAPQAFKLDPAHTFAVFRVAHLGYSTMIGSFNKLAGDLSLDQDNLAGSTIKVTIDTGSVFTNHGKRDDHLRSPDFFNAVEFPEMTFVSTEVMNKGDNTLHIKGDFTLLGVTKPVVLEATLNKVSSAPAAELQRRAGRRFFGAHQDQAFRFRHELCAGRDRR